MKEKPQGDALLATARALLRDEVIPALPPEQRHAALMIANAMAIAMRQFRNGEVQDRREIAALEHLLGPSVALAASPDGATRLETLNDALCHRIRSAARTEEIRAHLLETAKQKVLESNPKYLGMQG